MFGKKKRGPRTLGVWSMTNKQTKQVTSIQVTDWYDDTNGIAIEEDQNRPAIAIFPVGPAANEAEQRRRAEAFLKYLQKEQAVATAVQSLEMDN